MFFIHDLNQFQNFKVIFLAPYSFAFLYVFAYIGKILGYVFSIFSNLDKFVGAIHMIAENPALNPALNPIVNAANNAIANGTLNPLTNGPRAEMSNTNLVVQRHNNSDRSNAFIG